MKRIFGKIKALYLHFVIGSFCFHNWKITDIEYEVPSTRYGNVYFDIYTKKCKWCNKQKRVMIPYTANKCKVSINSKIMMNGIENKYYL